MIDTGSPISFVSLDVYKQFSDTGNIQLKPVNRSYSALNNTEIKLLGVVETTIVLENLPEFRLDVKFHVMKESLITADIIIGRDFLDNQNVAALYIPAKSRPNETYEFPHMLLSCAIERDEDDLENILREHTVDVSLENKERLIKMILEIQASDVVEIKDNYAVRVNLKDDSSYAYAPRRFAWKERQQVREITDDLLARGIIKISTSPYCARVMPVVKKNGKMRLCVDLRPLNQKVLKQKYPFPLIEDCLSRLSNKSIFTLLDPRDGFHQIRVHPEHTKYFGFATPDGQFEYTCLPFGFCEAPAEFQRRIVQILQSLIREDRVIVYIDDIFIPSETVAENLDTLRAVLLLLKSYVSPLALRER